MTEFTLTQVIGDKKGSGTAAILAHAEGRQRLQELQKTVVAPVKLIHVIRNPFDNIVTICIKSGLAQEIIPRNKVNQLLSSLFGEFKIVYIFCIYFFHIYPPPISTFLYYIATV